MAVRIEEHPLLRRSKDNAAMYDYWKQVGDIVEGYKAIKKARDEYLPKFSGETDDDYENRIKTTKFTNIYRDVLEGLSCKPFEEPVQLVPSDDGGEVNETILEFCKDVDGQGNTLSTFSAVTFFNGINNAMDWIFVDFPDVPKESIKTLKDFKDAKLKPYWTHVLAKNVLEANMVSDGGEKVLKYVRIYEAATEEDEEAVREFFRDDETGEVTWKLHRANPNAKEQKDAFILEREGTLTLKRIPLVPFITGRKDGEGFKLFPPMQDAADLQITLYNNESSLEFTKTMACYPMLAANGVSAPKDKNGNPEKLGVGPMRVLYAPPNGDGNHGSWAFIEPSAMSMEFMQKSIDKTKQDLRELGRQPLTALSTQLTTVTTSIAAGKARSAVSAWAYALKDALENALDLTLEFLSINYDPVVNVYTGFDNVSGDSTDLAELGKARERRDISRETYHSELKRRKVLSSDFNSDQEDKRLLKEIPSDMDFDGEETSDDPDEPADDPATQTS